MSSAFASVMGAPHPLARQPRITLDRGWPIAASAAAAVIVGAGATRVPTLALAAVALAAVVLVVAFAVRYRVADFAIVCAILVSGAVDLPRRISTGPITGLGLLTIVFAAALALIVTSTNDPRALRWPAFFRWMLVYLGWSMASFGWGSPADVADGIQNVLVAGAFVAAIYVTGCRISDPRFRRGVERSISLASWVAIALYGAVLLVAGLGGSGLITPRPFALFAVVILAWSLPGALARRPSDALLAFAAVAMIVLSLSRGAFAAALAVMFLAVADLSTIRGWMRTAAGFGLAVVIGLAAVTYVKPLHDRFFQGDVRGVGGGVSVNLTGREQFWETSWRSYTKSPLIGHGAGSSDRLMTEVFGTTASHAHNEYLRIAHDYGAVGLLVWVLAYGGAIGATWRRWRATRRDTRGHDRFHAAAFLALSGTALAAASDNPFVYVTIAVPVGVLVGASFGTPGLPPVSRLPGRPG